MEKGKRLTRAILVVGSTIECPDIEYVSGFRALDPVVLLVMPDRSKYLVVPELEEHRARTVAGTRGITVHTARSLRVKTTGRGDPSVWAKALLKQQSCRSVYVPERFPFGVATRLKASGIDVQIRRDTLFPERAIKSADEIRCIKESQRSAVIAMRAACNVLHQADVDSHMGLVWERQPLTAQKLRRFISAKLLDHDCYCEELLVACGEDTTDPHGRTHGRMHAEEPIILDIFPRHLQHGYWGDLTRTVVKGKAPKAVKAMYAAVKAAHAAALSKVRPGVFCSTIHHAAAEEMSRRGYRTTEQNGRMVGFIHSTGHGVGLSVHEEPAVGASKRRLKKGNVITIEPGLYYPGIGGIRIEDTIAVTGNGWTYLAPCEKRLEL